MVNGYGVWGHNVESREGVKSTAEEAMAPCAKVHGNEVESGETVQAKDSSKRAQEQRECVNPKVGGNQVEGRGGVRG